MDYNITDKTVPPTIVGGSFHDRFAQTSMIYNVQQCSTTGRINSV